MKYIVIICIVLLHLNSAELSCDGIEILQSNDANNPIPAGVCILDKHQSHKFECTCNTNINTAEMNKLTFNNSDCSDSPISIQPYTQSLHSANIPFHIHCKGIPCNYGIKRTHPTANCSDDVSTISSFSHDGDPYIIGFCEALPTSSFKIDSCNNAEKFNILYYEDSKDCSTTGELVNDPTTVQGYCDKDGTQYDIICGTAETQNINDINCDSTPPKQPSLYGTWSHNGIFAFSVEINSDCTEIIFTLVSPHNDTWFAVAMGGDYTDSGANVMNGYAIVQLFSALEATYETTLQPGETPFPHDNIGLECKNKENDGVRTSVCTRAYKTGETEEHDFYKFIAGGNYILWAFGDVTDRSGIPMKHGLGDIGERHIDVMYLHGEKDKLCGYAKEFDDAFDSGYNKDVPFSTVGTTGIHSYDKTSEMDQDMIDSNNGMKSEDNKEWVIMGIVFMILFGIAVILLIYFVSVHRCKQKDEEQKYEKTKTKDLCVDSDCNDSEIQDVDKQMETVTVPGKRQGEIVQIPEHSDLDGD